MKNKNSIGYVGPHYASLIAQYPDKVMLTVRGETERPLDVALFAAPDLLALADRIHNSPYPDGQDCADMLRAFVRGEL